MKRLFERGFIIVLAFLMLAVVLLSSCMSLPNTKNLKEKGVCVNGYVSVQNLDTGYNPVTKTFTPKFLFILARGFWSSIPLSKDIKDYVYFRIEELSSVWNSASIDKTYTLIFATENKELMKLVLEKISSSIKTANKSKEAASGETPSVPD